MMKFIRLLAIALVLLAGCKSTVDDIDRWSVVAADPVVTVGHGSFVDERGNEFDPSPDVVIEAQRFYIKRMYSGASADTKARFNALRKELSNMSADNKAEQILINAALIDWLAEAVQPTDLAHLTSKNTALLSRYFRPDGLEPAKGSGPNPSPGPVRPALTDRLKGKGLLKFLSTTAGGPDYIAQCREAGVPIPPDWGTPAWRSLGMLSTKFISKGIDAELYAFESESPPGMCFALPRSSGDTISLLGVICLGTRSSKSCYWDNQRNKVQFSVQKNTVLPLSNFAGGGDLFKGQGGVCTDCHSGENPFIVHPGQPMDLGSRITPAAWMQPLVHPAWPQNQGPNSVVPSVALAAGDQSCLNCHTRPPGRRFPEVSTAIPGYCGTILPQAISTTMPSSSNPGLYKKHIDALMAACKQPPSSGVVINGATQSTPTSDRSDTGGDLSACSAGAECPLGFCYWRTLHGPFWQKTDSSIPIGDANYRGSFARIYAEGGKWKWRAFSDPTGGPPNAPPGGTAECTNYNQIATVPDPKACFASMFTVFDKDGSQAAQSTDATVTGMASANVLSGFIGNVAQTSIERRPDTLRVGESGGKILLAQGHLLTPPAPLKVGPLTGESWTNGCTGWTPVYIAKEVQSTSDVQLVAAADADNARCYITGITGGWSSTRNNATVQPFAEIYKGSGGDLRLRVSPTGENDRVSAYASCIRLK